MTNADEIREASKTNAQFSPTPTSLHGQLLVVQKELRARIQELILFEISADRNAPVPQQYRELVDRYFRSIAGDDEPPVLESPKP